MALTYTDSDKIVLEAWGKFRVTLLEAVEPGDLLSWYNTDNAYTVQFADQSDSQRADCIAIDKGVAGAEIWACLKAELGTIPTIGDQGVPTTVYFAAAADFFGAPLYLGEDGKPSSSEGGTYSQQIGRLVARDRIMLDMTSANVYDAATFTGTTLISEDNRVNFRDSGIYMQSPVDGRLTIAADGTGQTYGIMFMLGAGKSIYVSSAIQFADQGVSNYDEEGTVWFSSSTKKLEWYNSTEIRYIVDSDTDGAVTLTSDLTISGTNKRIYFRNANIWIGSISTTQIQISSPGTTDTAIYLTTGAGGGVLFGSYLGLFKTDTDSVSEGQIWYDESENRPKVHCGPDGVLTLAVV